MRQRIQALALAFVVVASAFAVGPAAAAGGAQTSNHASVTFDAQTSGGYTVTVDSVTLAEGGFVTIHDASVTEGDVLASVVGSSAYLSPGTHENVTVRLDQPVSEDATLVAMPHKDTDGDRVYEFVSANGGADGPYTADGSAVVDTANVTVSASVSASDQPTDGNTIVLDRVELSESGFVAVHDSTVLDGAVFDSVVGHSDYLEAGVHENVRVTLDEAVGNETLIPMPHKDTDDDQSYSFVESEGGADGPFTNMAGDAVVTTASVTAAQEASATFDAQTSGGNAVVVDSVFVPEGGFVTMHDASVTEGAVFDSVRGTSDYLEPGLHRNVVVRLDDPVNDTSTLVAMPHKDTDGDQTYDFVNSEGGDDGPYTADGGAVVDTGDVTVSASVTYDTQESDGNTVTIDRVDLSEPGFVAIHDPSVGAGEVFDSVLGHSAYLEAGVHTDVTVTLDEAANESQTLVAMPHKDTDGDGSYTFVESEGGADGPFTANGGAVVDAGDTLVTANVVTSNQQSDGTTVTVDSVTLADGGFVTIHDASVTEGAVFESVRGTSDYLAPGTHENVTIELDSALSGDATVVPMAHMDTDGDQTYDFVSSDGADDGPYTAAGSPVLTTAMLDLPATASVTFDDQSSMGDRVTIDEATLSEGGFVVIHASDDGAPGEVLGHTAYLDAGTHEDLDVQLTSEISGETELVAMAHVDSDGDRTYEFPDADGPYTMDGSAVVDAGTVSVGSMDTTTEMMDTTESMDDTTENESGGDTPGFGVAVALVALLGAALLALRE